MSAKHSVYSATKDPLVTGLLYHFLIVEKLLKKNMLHASRDIPPKLHKF